MKKFNLDDMIGGWFVGDFNPSLIKQSEFEVAIKRYSKGDKETNHLHKIATEITVIVEGKVIMNDKEYTKNDILFITPGEATDFIVLEDTITVVVKSPSVPDDKYVIN